MTHALTGIQQLKLRLLSSGVGIDGPARAARTDDGNAPLTVNDYATTGGLTIVLPEGVYVNAPINASIRGPRARPPAGVVRFDPDSAQYLLETEEGHTIVELLPQPGYVGRGDGLADGVMTHADRARLMPVDGCSCSCGFCDAHLRSYMLRPWGTLKRALDIALSDPRLPARHVLVSGGTPITAHRSYLDDVYRRLIEGCPCPVDVMLAPRPGSDIIDKLVEWGVGGLAINLELWDDAIASHLTPFKQVIGKAEFARTIAHAVELTGGAGRVRSLLLVGLEPPESTLSGVEFLAEMGCDPCLSPFRPAVGTPLASRLPPSPESMAEVYLAARDIADKYGVKLGPRCIPCQHNTIAFPDDDGAFYYS